MNRKVTLPELVEALMEVTNTKKRVSETFLRELFALISEQVISGESVKIKGLGTFKVVSVDARRSVDVNTGEEIVIASHNKVTFVVDKELAEAVNMPFASFETVQLNDDIPEEEMKIIEADAEVESESVPVAEVIPETVEVVEESLSEPEPVEEQAEEIIEETIEAPVIEEVIEESVIEEPVIAEVVAPTEVIEEIVEEPVVEEPIDALVHVPESELYEEYQEEVKVVAKRKFLSGYLWGVISAAIVVGVVFVLMNFDINIAPKTEVTETVDIEAVNDESADSISAVYLSDGVVSTELVTIKAEQADSIVSDYIAEEVVVAEPEVEEVIKKDTITKTRFMATMAREHFGDMNFWVYIYEENKGKIRNPNVVAPGTVLVIPAAEKYGIDANDPESVRTAVIKSRAVSARFK